MKCLLRFYWSYRRQIKMFSIVFSVLVLFVIANIAFRFIDDAIGGNNLTDTGKQASVTAEIEKQPTSVDKTAHEDEQPGDTGDYKYGAADSQTNSTAEVPDKNNLPAKSTASTLKPSATPVVPVSHSPSAGKGGTKSSTPTPKSTPKPSGVAVVSPIPSPSTVNSGTKSTGTLGVLFANSNTAKSTNTVSFGIKLTNTGSASVKLSDVRLRYYYSIDGDKKQNFWCDWSSAGSGNVNGKFVRVSSADNKADHYLEIGFSDRAKSLEPGGSAEIQARFAKDDWSDYDQSNDYSYNPSGKGYTNWNKVTMYISGKLKYGIEP